MLETKVIIEQLPVGGNDHLERRAFHAFHSFMYSQLLEYSVEPYNPADTYPYKVVI